MFVLQRTVYTRHSSFIYYSVTVHTVHWVVPKKDETNRVDFQDIYIKNHLIVVIVKDVKCV